MTDTPSFPPPPGPAPKRHRRKSETLDAMRQLAREAAEAGEPLRQIARRLKLPRTTLTDWAREDGFRKQDLKAKAKAAAAAASEADKIRQRAEEAAQRAAKYAEEDEDPYATPNTTDVEIRLARARVGALLEAGYLPEAEADMRAARRLTSLASFAAPARKQTEAATRQMKREASNAALYTLALQVCACWAEGDAPPPHLPWVVSGMFQKRLAITRECVRALYPQNNDSNQEMTEQMFFLAREDWFLDFHPLLREAISTLSVEGNRALADKLSAYLKEEQAALPKLTAWAAENGYRYWGEP